MRGRTNIAQVDGIVVNGDMITATAVENIGKGDFVSYTIDAQIKDIAGITTSINRVKVSGNKIYSLIGNVLYIFENLDGELKLISIYSDHYILDFEILDNNHLIISSGSKTSSSNRISQLIILEESAGVLSVVSNQSVSYYADNNTGQIAFDGNYIYLLNGTHATSSNVFNVSAYEYSDTYELTLFREFLNIYTYTGYSMYIYGFSSVGKYICFLCDKKTTVTSDYSYEVFRFSSDFDGYFSKDIGKKSVAYTFIEPKWFLYGPSSPNSDATTGTGTFGSPVIYLVDLVSGQTLPIDLKQYGFIRTVDGSNYSKTEQLNLYKISESKIMVSFYVSASINSTRNGFWDIGILNFDNISAIFSKTEPVDVYDTFYSDKQAVISATTVFSSEKNYYGISYYSGTTGNNKYIDLSEENGILYLKKDENKVEKYKKGNKAIGFAKTSAKTGDEIQVWIPKTEE